MFIKWINNERIGSSYTVYHFLLYIVFVWVSHLSSWINKSFRARTMWSIFISLTTAYPNSYRLNKWAKLLGHDSWGVVRFLELWRRCIYWWCKVHGHSFDITNTCAYVMFGMVVHLEWRIRYLLEKVGKEMKGQAMPPLKA